MNLKILSNGSSFIVLLLFAISWSACFVGPIHPCDSDVDCSRGYVCYDTFCTPSSEVPVNPDGVSGDGGSEKVGEDLDTNSQNDESSCPKICKEGAKRNCFPKGLSGCDLEKESCQGSCSLGQQSCEKMEGCFVWGACKEFQVPKEETCNNRDDDCNGSVDDIVEKPCYQGPDGTSGKGVCKKGTQQCVGGRWSSCQGDVTPSDEVCDQVDNDCDGEIDETCACQTNAKRACYGFNEGCSLNGKAYECFAPCKSGIQTCVGGKWGSCEGDLGPTEEKCDRKDNNCNGQIDENLKQACYSPKDRSTIGKGACREGFRTCQQGKWSQECRDEVSPKTELCNGIDDDCNGSVDDTFPTQGQACDSGKPGICRVGKLFCSQGNIRCKPNLQPAPNEPCDGKDNDCDGQTDEGCDCQKNATQPCYSASSGCTKPTGGAFVCTNPCKTGLQTCENGMWGACKGEQGPVSEFCDGKDNNCNGQIDEKLVKACYNGPTVTKDKGICRGGTSTCSNGAWSQCNGEVKPSREVCNGADDDCDGKIDEEFPDKNAACQSQRLGICKPGKWACTGGSRFCAPTVQPRAETCNKLDDDCDGKADEGCVITVSPPGVLKGPRGITIDKQGNVLIADADANRIYKLDPVGKLTSFAGNGKHGFRDDSDFQAQFAGLRDVKFDSQGNLYVADASNNRIRKVDTLGNVTTVAGVSSFGLKDGPALQAMFGFPVNLYIDPKNHIYIVDWDNSRIRKLASGQVTTVAGSQDGEKDGPALQAEFYYPEGIAPDRKGNLYIADGVRNRIRKLDTNNQVTTVAGDGTSGFRDGKGLNARFDRLGHIVVDALGRVYVADRGNNRIRMLDPSGNVSTVIGDGTMGNKDGFALKTKLNRPYGLAFDRQGNLYISDYGNKSIRKWIRPQ